MIALVHELGLSVIAEGVETVDSSPSSRAMAASYSRGTWQALRSTRRRLADSMDHGPGEWQAPRPAVGGSVDRVQRTTRYSAGRQHLPGGACRDWLPDSYQALT